MTDPAPRDRDEIERDLGALHLRSGVGVWARWRLARDVRPLLDRLDATERRIAAVEKLCSEAEAGEGIIVTPGFTTYYSVETGLLRLALAAVPGVAENSEQRQDEQR